MGFNYYICDKKGNAKIHIGKRSFNGNCCSKCGIVYTGGNIGCSICGLKLTARTVFSWDIDPEKFDRYFLKKSRTIENENGEKFTYDEFMELTNVTIQSFEFIGKDFC